MPVKVVDLRYTGCVKRKQFANMSVRTTLNSDSILELCVCRLVRVILPPLKESMNAALKSELAETNPQAALMNVKQLVINEVFQHFSF